jgi:hypothetical protein
MWYMQGERRLTMTLRWRLCCSPSAKSRPTQEKSTRTSDAKKATPYLVQKPHQIWFEIRKSARTLVPCSRHDEAPLDQLEVVCVSMWSDEICITDETDHRPTPNIAFMTIAWPYFATQSSVARMISAPAPRLPNIQERDLGPRKTLRGLEAARM